MFRKLHVVVLAGLFCVFSISPVFAQEDALWEIYNTIYGGNYVTSNQNLEDTYGVSYDEALIETNGYVEASARFAGYTQKFGYYTDLCVGNNQIELFDVTTTSYLSGYTTTFLPGGGSDMIGLYTDPSTGGPWFIQPDLNSDGCDHMRTFRAPGFDPLNPEYLIAWEDLENLGDADYNDLVLIINYLEPYEVVCCEYDSDCPDDGLYCNGDEICEDNVCTHTGDPCPDDGLYCNGVEGCDEGSDMCTHTGDPCPDDGLYCNGDESCDEVNDMCMHSGDPCVPDLTCDEDQDLCYEVTIDVGDGSGARGSINNLVEVSLDNPDTEVRAMQMDICDVDNYLTCTGCALTVRTEGDGVICSAGELGNGCCRILLYDYTVPWNLIEVGTGPIFTVNYDVSAGAPAGECRDLNPENVLVADVYGDPLEKRSLGGEFCFSDCSSDLDCDDGLYCSGDETCDVGSGICQSGTPPCPDDGLYCTGVELCDEATDTCYQSGDPCLPDLVCDEELDQCIDNCEIEIYTGGAPVPPLNTYNKPGRRGLVLTCGETVQFSWCSDCTSETPPYNDPCPEWSITVLSGFPPMGTSFDTTSGLLTIGPDCSYLDAPAELLITVTDPCNHDISDSVTIIIGEIFLEVVDTNAHPGDEGVSVKVNLSNPYHMVKGIQTDIQDEGDYLYCTGCAPDPDRALPFMCSAQEQADGDCRVVMVTTNPTALIQEGEGSVFTVDYEVSGNAPSDDCIDLTPADSKIADRFGDELCVCELTGEICFFICGDVYPADCLGQPVCGDGVVDIFDILEEIDFVLGLATPTTCQIPRSDVPNGTPPYCSDPDGDVDIFDVLVIIDMALGKVNCCDYYYFAQIY